jgi:hypothetical protein
MGDRLGALEVGNPLFTSDRIEAVEKVLQAREAK